MQSFVSYGKKLRHKKNPPAKKFGFVGFPTDFLFILYYNVFVKSRTNRKFRLKGEMNMKRKIIKIDREKCTAAGACAACCHEGAIDMIDGKAVLMRENYCDGLGDCLPACPTGAITFEEREAPAYDEAAVMAAKNAKEAANPEAAPLPCGCPGTKSRLIRHEAPSEPKKAAFSSGQGLCNGRFR